MGGGVTAGSASMAHCSNLPLPLPSSQPVALESYGSLQPKHLWIHQQSSHFIRSSLADVWRGLVRVRGRLKVDVLLRPGKARRARGKKKKKETKKRKIWKLMQLKFNQTQLNNYLPTV